MLKGKNIILGVTGGIAAYKIANLASMLSKLGCNIDVIMTKNACNFINPIVFETLTGNKCLIDTFDRNFDFQVEHVALAKKADVILVAPATANVIGKIANGIADDMLTTTFVACKCHKIIAPAMNTNMYRNPIVQDNIQKLKRFGMEVIKPDTGLLACKDVGEGKMPSEQLLLDYILKAVAYTKDLSGQHILITAGATRERIDPVRYLSNHSTGKMGYALAKNAMLRGAQVTLISGKTYIPKVPFVDIIMVESASDMYAAILERFSEADIIIKAAAVADYRPKVIQENKIKKKDGDLSLDLERTEDILGYLGENKRPGQFLCGFSMETENVIENSIEKFRKKRLDMIVANSLNTEGAGFGTDTNIVTLITPSKTKELSIMSKDKVAEEIFNSILDIKNNTEG